MSAANGGVCPPVSAGSRALAVLRMPEAFGQFTRMITSTQADSPGKQVSWPSNLLLHELRVVQVQVPDTTNLVIFCFFVFFLFNLHTNAKQKNNAMVLELLQFGNLVM
eukprot:gnl/MRDRNA2_/MRDRNA2_222143_c0_seq1.p1 gnl/MRDRNA2_/MRDRNA2_222143_c0~~gnl/MRDRNA2_/MRDRNA2_222143_c0_seq1.p1  ORF type:complete len:108 (-),score=12.56 gnl/MRDRNA2_/MRDRNA2_222143_c0_seq1:21-344(-)